MVKEYGATAAEWDYFIGQGLSSDLLPVVSNPNAVLSPQSKIAGPGKVPSQYNGLRLLTGFAKWTRHEASECEIETWRAEPDYGVCVQTRYLRALDIDVDDHALAADIFEYVQDVLGVTPMRSRGNSGKCLIPVFLEGELGKRVLPVHGGNLEFLANGQQFVAAGTHPSGARYEWQYLDTPIPKIDLAQFEELWDGIAALYATGDSKIAKVRNRNIVNNNDIVTDTRGDWLIKKGFVHDYGANGMLFLQCPRHEHHSSASNGTDFCYFPAGTNGYVEGQYKCMHASCQDIDLATWDYLFGYTETAFDAIPYDAENAVRTLPAFECNKIGRPLQTLPNLSRALARPDMMLCHIKYDKFMDDNMYFSCDEQGNMLRDSEGKVIKTRELSNTQVALRRHLESAHAFVPVKKEMMRDAILDHCGKEENIIDSAQLFLDSLEWDGAPRVSRFFSDYMGCEHDEYTEAVSLYWWSGLAGRIITPGAQCDMVPVLVSPEGMSKSSGVAAIAPAEDMFMTWSLMTQDADFARQTRGKLVAEIAELRGLKTRDEESILNAISTRKEEWIPKYVEQTTARLRRFMPIATTNEYEFLQGARRHRRWLPMEVIREADRDAIARDRKQLFAEAAVLYKKNKVMYKRAEELGDDRRGQFRVRDTWEDILNEWLTLYRDENGKAPGDAEFITVHDALRYGLGLDAKSIKRTDEMRCAGALRALGYEAERRRVGGRSMRVYVKPLW